VASKPDTVGVLALHGDFAEHGAVLRNLGCAVREVRTVEDLLGLHRLVIPGGESTVIGMLMEQSGLLGAIRERVLRRELPIFGTCAGAILLAREVRGQAVPPHLGVMDIAVERNAYGRQAQSFAADITVQGVGVVPVSFIRAPRIIRTGPGVHVLASHGGYPVLVRQDRLLAATFHPEVRGSAAVHSLFLLL